MNVTAMGSARSRRGFGLVLLLAILASTLAMLIGPAINRADAYTRVGTTLYFNKQETERIGSGYGTAAAVACGAIATQSASAGAICGLYVGTIYATAKLAKDRGKCLKIRFIAIFPSVYPSGWHTPDARYCR